MILKIRPTASIRGILILPASKSYSIRVFITAACGGRSKIIRPSDCEDAKIAIQAARSLGSKIQKSPNNIWKVEAFKAKAKLSKIHVGESGTVLRFLLPLVALRAKKSIIVGKGTLVGRPNNHLTRTLRKIGLKVRGKGKNESVPIKITKGHFSGGDIEIEGTLSSQFISALLIACPGLPCNSRLRMQGKKLVSQTYVTMTRQVLLKSGVKIQKKGSRSFVIQGRQEFGGLKEFVVPSDYGLAAFLLGAAALLDSNVTLKGNLKNDLVQSDGEILKFLCKMGVKFTKTKSFIKVAGPFSIKGGSFSLKNCPDLLPIMAVLALFAKGRTRLYDIAHALHKLHLKGNKYGRVKKKKQEWYNEDEKIGS